jgi:hypothetical protein
VKYELGFYIPEDDILHSHRFENLESYMLIAVNDFRFLHRETVNINLFAVLLCCVGTDSDLLGIRGNSTYQSLWGVWTVLCFERPQWELWGLMPYLEQQECWTGMFARSGERTENHWVSGILDFGPHLEC